MAAPAPVTRPHPIPLRAVFISLGALAIPLLGGTMLDDQAREFRILIWLAPLVPGFLWAYYRGWRGAAAGFAGAMVVLAIGQAVLLGLGERLLDSTLITSVVAVSAVVTFGVGAVAELLHRERERAMHLAYTDELTGLPNRRHLNTFLAYEFAAAQRGRPLVVVMFDLDEFKRFNDRHGHAAGDEVLRGWAETLSRTTRRMNLSARVGGEEFVSVVADATVEGALVFVERARQGMAARSFRGQTVTVSAGVAAYDPSMESMDDLVAAADAALYEAKAEGRDSVRVLGSVNMA